VPDLLISIILGIIQGLTEFLPVSSSGHLELAKYLLGDKAAGQQSLFFTIMVHVATALSTIYIFRKDIAEILKGLFAKPWNESKSFTINVIISMIPAALVGFFAEPFVESLFDQKIGLVGAMMLVTAVLLLLADRSKSSGRKVSRLDALLIGIAQAVAILPGISRSGATISTSMMLGIDRYSAARFSFLMVVPLILGKICYDLISGDIALIPGELVNVTAGFIAAFITGALSCKLMISIVQKSQLKYFALYCAVVGIFAIILLIR
jgi:undecaprenyl-diphosphatase